MLRAIRKCCRRCAACDGLPHWQRFPRFAAVVVHGWKGQDGKWNGTKKEMRTDHLE